MPRESPDPPRSMEKRAEPDAEEVRPHDQGDQSLPECQLQVSQCEQPSAEPETAHEAVLLDADLFVGHTGPPGRACRRSGTSRPSSCSAANALLSKSPRQSPSRRTTCRLTTSTSPRYVSVANTRNAKYDAGG